MYLVAENENKTFSFVIEKPTFVTFVPEELSSKNKRKTVKDAHLHNQTRLPEFFQKVSEKEEVPKKQIVVATPEEEAAFQDDSMAYDPEAPVEMSKNDLYDRAKNFYSDVEKEEFF